MFMNIDFSGISLNFLTIYRIKHYTIVIETGFYIDNTKFQIIVFK